MGKVYCVGWVHCVGELRALIAIVGFNLQIIMCVGNSNLERRTGFWSANTYSENQVCNQCFHVHRWTLTKSFDLSPSTVVMVEFDPTTYTVSESSLFANITVLKRGESTQAVSVEFTTADDSAIG